MPDSSPPTQTWTGAKLRGAPPVLFGALLGVELLAGVLGGLALADERPGGPTLLRLLLLLGLCVVFEEISLQVTKLRSLITGSVLADMTSVWSFAGVLVLPPGYAGLLAIGVAAHVWIRRDRSRSAPTYRRVYTTTTWVLGALGAASVRALAQAHLDAAPSWLAALSAIVAAALAYTAITRALIVLAVRLSSAQVRLSLGMLIGSWSDNALELSTLCLGAMTAVVVLHQPAVAVLVLLPMVLLQRGALVKELETAASVDTKTGLLNAGAWEAAVKQELTRVERDESTAAVLLIDLDHFKAVNDTYGHLAGDEALRLVGLRLAAEFRQSDVVGRFGGEEFVAFLPRLGVAEALAVAERIRAAIATISFDQFAPDGPPELRERPLTSSIGLALLPAHGTELDELLRAADTALYAAKHAGRNRVVLAGDPGHREPEFQD